MCHPQLFRGGISSLFIRCICISPLMNAAIPPPLMFDCSRRLLFKIGTNLEPALPDKKAANCSLHVLNLTKTNMFTSIGPASRPKRFGEELFPSPKAFMHVFQVSPPFTKSATTFTHFLFSSSLVKLGFVMCLLPNSGQIFP